MIGPGNVFARWSYVLIVYTFDRRADKVFAGLRPLFLGVCFYCGGYCHGGFRMEGHDFIWPGVYSRSSLRSARTFTRFTKSATRV